MLGFQIVAFRCEMFFQLEEFALQMLTAMWKMVSASEGDIQLFFLYFSEICLYYLLFSVLLLDKLSQTKTIYLSSLAT